MVDRINQLDLGLIKFKLSDPHEGPGWTNEEIERAEVQYRRFLILNAIYPDRHIVPTKQVDKFWHQHILDTRKYGEDCQEAFGYFLHHFPYFGLRGPEDAQNLKNAFAETNELLILHFGEAALSANAADCDSSACDGQPNCGSSCTGLGR